jgi:hypothetical protein
LAIFDALDGWFNGTDVEGCLFVKSLLETHDHSNGVRAATVAGMSRVRDIALELAVESGADDAPAVAQKLYMLVNGSIVGAEPGYRRRYSSTASTLRCCSGAGCSPSLAKILVT